VPWPPITIMMGTTVKSERHDDAEINEMARRIMEQNRQKVAQQPGIAPMGYPPGQIPAQMAMSRPGQPMMTNYLTGNNMHLNNSAHLKATPGGSDKKVEKAIDEESKKGRFGWAEFDKIPLPYIYRVSGGEKTEKYTSVRMVERKHLNHFSLLYLLKSILVIVFVPTTLLTLKPNC